MAMSDVNGRVVLVDDDREMLQELEEMLEFEGFQIIAVPIVEDIGEVDWTDVDTLVVDFFIPGSSGPEIAENARLMNPDVTVVFVSGADLNHLLEREHIPGARVLSKPVDPDALLELIDKT
ncbi:MAG: response regulator [Guyparkeria sp.]|uniref:response regulator n=1 Tax=Guyparkeria sp. TaxID=2035736 RepID=UPI00397AEE3F